MSYNSSTYKITAPVSVGDVRSAIGSSSGDVGTLCRHANINMWAKWKPIKAPYVGLLTSTIMEGLANTYRYGINRSGAGSVALWNPSTGELNHDVWQYDKPTGGASAPYRLADFANWDAHANAGYYHLAPCPVKMIFPDPLEIEINDQQGSNTTAFVFTFENGIAGWHIDGTCLSIADIFTSAERGYYLTVGLLRWDNGVMKQYFVSSSQRLGEMSQSNPVAIVLMDQNDFRSKFGTNYLTQGQQWQAIMFLSGRQYAGDTSMSGSIVMLEYEQNADRRTMTIARTTWAQGFGTVSLTTTIERQSTWQYRVTKYGGYGITITAVRNDTTNAANFNVSLRLVCVGGTIGSGGSEVQIDGVGQLSFAVNQSTATLNIANLTGYDFNFISQATPKRAIVNIIMTRTSSSGSISLGTDIDCLAGNSSYTATNQNEY